MADEVGERLLNHAPRGPLKVCNRHRYEAEMRDALERRERRLPVLIGEAPASNVVPLRAG